MMSEDQMRPLLDESWDVSMTVALEAGHLAAFFGAVSPAQYTQLLRNLIEALSGHEDVKLGGALYRWESGEYVIHLLEPGNPLVPEPRRLDELERQNRELRASLAACQLPDGGHRP